MNVITQWAKSRRFFVTAVVGLVFVVLRENLGIPVDEEAARAITESLVLFIIGESAAATAGWNQLLQNPRFWVFSASITNAVLRDRLGLQVPPETLQQLLVMLQTLLTGYAIRPHLTPKIQ